jgi:isopenicillin-N N-acyltransferase-like protein
MFPTIEVKGSAFERGRQHGERARGRVERSIATYARLFAYCGMDWREAQQRAAPYREVIGAFDPALLEEIEGIAAGAGPSLAPELRIESVAGIVMELDKRVMHVAPDVPSKTGFRAVALERETALA